MRPLLTIAWLQIRLTFQNRGYVAMMFVMPLALYGVVALATGSGAPRPAPLAVADADGSFAAGRLLAALQADGSLRVRVAAPGEIDGLLADHSVAAGLIIPAGYERSLAAGAAPELTLLTAPGGGDAQSLRPSIARTADAVATACRAALQSARDPSDLPAAYDRAMAGRPTVSVAQAAAGSQAKPMQAERMAGFAVMFVFMTVLMLGSAFRQEQRAGTWGRILLSPAGKTAVLGGYIASMVMAGLIQFGGLAALSRLLFGIRWGALLPLAAMATATVFCAAGLGLFLAGITRSAEQQQLLAMGLAMVTALVGGVYWSLDLMDASLRRIGHLTPQAWAMDGLRAVVLRGGQWTAVATPAAVLLTAGLLLAAGGLWRLRPE